MNNNEKEPTCNSPVSGSAGEAEIYENLARRAILGDDAWEPVADSERTAPDEEISIVASGENWTQFSDGETLYYEDDIPFYLE